MAAVASRPTARLAGRVAAGAVAGLLLLPVAPVRAASPAAATPSAAQTRATSGPCAGQFQVRPGSDALGCTGGPEQATVPAGAPAPAPAGAGSTARSSLACVEDGSSGPRVRVVYAYVAGRPNNLAQSAGAISTSVQAVEDQFHRSAAQVGADRGVRWVQDPATCAATITAVQVPATDLQSVTTAVQGALGAAADRKYLVYLDDPTHNCIASGYGDDDPNPRNLNNGHTPATVAMLDSSSWPTTSVCAAHELMHSLGAVQRSAPDNDGGNHCNVTNDPMCIGSRIPTYAYCTTYEDNFLYDCRKRNYFNPSPALPADNYLASHWNTANSDWLTGAPSRFSVDDASAVVGATSSSVTFLVRRSSSVGQAYVPVHTADGTATAASGDYSPVDTVVVFADGQPLAPVTVSVRGRTAGDAATETLFLALGTPSSGTLVQDGVGTATLINNSNDAFATPRVLSGSSGSLTGTVQYGTLEPGERIANGSRGQTMWYAWTPAGSGPATVDLCGSGPTGALLAVWTGSSVTALSQIGAGTNTSCPDFAAQYSVSWTAVAGTTYRIQADRASYCPTCLDTFQLNWSGPTSSAAVPGAPTGVSATAGNASATVSWSPPASDGGSPVTGYTVTASPGGATASTGGSGRSAVVSGLTNGTSYTFTVGASNTVGPGPASAPSPAVVPKAPAKVVEDSALQLGSWARTASSVASGGSYRSSAVSGATASATFTGTGVTWSTVGLPKGGQAAVSIDGAARGTVDLYRSSATALSFTYSGLAAGTHTLTVKVLHAKSASSSGYVVPVDAVRVGSTTWEDSGPAITFDRWVGATTAGASGGTTRTSTSTGATITRAFTGTGVTVLAVGGPAAGQVRVLVDGVDRGLFDLYRPGTQAVSLPVGGLASGSHKVVLKVDGTRNASSTGTAVTIDGVTVSP